MTEKKSSIKQGHFIMIKKDNPSERCNNQKHMHLYLKIHKAETERIKGRDNAIPGKIPKKKKISQKFFKNLEFLGNHEQPKQS